MEKMKAHLDNISDDRKYFQGMLYKAKKVNKALIFELEQFKSGN